MALMMAQSGRTTPAEGIGTPREAAQKITKPASLVKEEWPSDAPKLGPLLVIDSREVVRLPSSFGTMRMSVNAQVKMVVLFIDADSDADLVVAFVDSQKLFAPSFDIFRRLKGVVPKSELPSIWPRIEAIDKRTDEQKFKQALAATMNTYRAAADYPAAADTLNGLIFRANFGLGNYTRVRSIATTGNQIYAHSHGGGMEWRLWVFDNQGGLLGEVHCQKEYWSLALAMSQSMGQSSRLSRIDTPKGAYGKIEPVMGDTVPESTPERLRKIALAVHLYHAQYHGKYPKSLKELVDRKILPKAMLRGSEAKDGQFDVVYIRPVTASEGWDDNPPIMLYPRNESWPEDGLWVGLADGAVSLVESEAEFRDLMKVHTDSGERRHSDRELVGDCSDP
jgi:hypothetical protein